MRADLHTHSYFSDGEFAPARLAALAKDRGLELFSLTDHDTLDGTEEARTAAESLGLRYLTGVELSTHGNFEIHVLGYNTDNNEILADLCVQIAKKRIERAEKMVRNLRERYGFAIAIEDVLEESGRGCAVCRIHLARAMVKRGYSANVRDCFREYIGVHTPSFVKTHEISSGEAVEVLAKGGSVPVLAHPCQIGADDATLRTILRELKARGLAGIEAHYSTHTNSEAEYYEKLAEEFGLICTVGSDFHGGDRANRMGEPESELGEAALKTLKIR